MLTKVMKWSAIAALLGGILPQSLPDVGSVLHVVISTAAVIVLGQAASMRRYVWMTLFFLIACLFNPVFPLPFSGNYVTGIVTTYAAVLFFLSLELLTPKPTLSTASIADRISRRESL